MPSRGGGGQDQADVVVARATPFAPDPVDLDDLGPAPLPPPDRGLPTDDDEDPWRPAPGDETDDPPLSEDHVTVGGGLIGGDDEGGVDVGGLDGGIGDPGPDVDWSLEHVPDDPGYHLAEDTGATLIDDDPDD